MLVSDTISHIVKIFWDDFNDEKAKAKLGVKTVAGIKEKRIIKEKRSYMLPKFNNKFEKELAEADQQINGGSLLDIRKFSYHFTSQN